MSNTAIADHALFSDRHSTALVDLPDLWNGWASRVSTHPRFSVGCWVQMRGTGASGRAGTGPAPADTWIGH